MSSVVIVIKCSLSHFNIIEGRTHFLIQKNLLDSDLLSKQNFDNLLVTPMWELTIGNFTEFLINFEMPLNHRFEIYFMFYTKFSFPLW